MKTMKRFLGLLLTLSMLLGLTVSVNADTTGHSAYDKLNLYDDADSETFASGNATYKKLGGGGYARFDNVEFGETGAKSVTIGVGGGSSGTIQPVYVWVYDPLADTDTIVHNNDGWVKVNDDWTYAKNCAASISKGQPTTDWNTEYLASVDLNFTVKGTKTVFVAAPTGVDVFSVQFSENKVPVTYSAFDELKFADCATAYNYGNVSGYFGGWKQTAYAKFENVDFGDKSPKKVTVKAGSGASYVAPIKIYVLDSTVDTSSYIADTGYLKDENKNNITPTITISSPNYDGWNNYNEQTIKVDAELTGMKTVIVATGNNANLYSIQFSTESLPVDAYKNNNFVDVAEAYNYNSVSTYIGGWQPTSFTEIDNVVFGEEGATSMTIQAGSGASYSYYIRVYAIDATTDTTGYYADAGYVKTADGTDLAPIAVYSSPTYLGWTEWDDYKIELTTKLTGTKTIFVATGGSVNLKSIQFHQQTAYDVLKFTDSEYSNYTPSSGALGNWKTNSFAKFEGLDFGELGATAVNVVGASDPTSSSVALKIRVYAVDASVDTTGYYAESGYLKTADGKDITPVAVISDPGYTDWSTYPDAKSDLTNVLTGEKTIFVATVGAINLKTIQFTEMELSEDFTVISPVDDGTIDSNGQKLEIKFSNYFNSEDIDGKIEFVQLDSNDNDVAIRGGYEVIKADGIINSVTLKFGRLDSGDDGVYILRIASLDSINDIALEATELYLVAEAIETNFVIGVIRESKYASKSITYTFNDDLDDTTLENITVTDSNGNDVTVTPSYVKTTRALTLTFTDDLEKGESYTISLAGVKNGLGETLTYTKTLYIADTFALNSVTFKADSQDVETIADIEFGTASTVVANMTFVNLAEDNETPTVIIAVYEGEKLVTAGAQQITVSKTPEAGAVSMMPLDISEVDEGDYTIKLFVWEDLINLEPVFVPYILDGTGVHL